MPLVFFFTNKKSKSMKFVRNKDGGEDEEDRVPAAEAARRRFFPPSGKTMMNEENALKTFRLGAQNCNRI